MRLNVGMLPAFFANLSLAISDGARRKPYGKPFSWPPAINSKMVNGSALDLFPLTNVLNKYFIPTAITSRRGLLPVGSNSSKSLLASSFHSVMTSH
jgi:hypothetical protein